MIDNGSVLNVCPVSTLKQMNMDMSRIRASSPWKASPPSRHTLRKALQGHSGSTALAVFPRTTTDHGGTFDGPITESDDFSSNAIEVFLALPAIYAVTEETSFGVHIRPAWEDEELTNWTAVPLYSAIVADV
ncbi:hypothetical protein CRG98_007631 [Punica granatum]|uniref:Uncharacterized protein n=1 Tax=Punica granatum TaxID=22663 RepID=A0A2I0KTZ9_PUNGR|nr:hypothetical protein CRG98_007631 [Punica granatum]